MQLTCKRSDCVYWSENDCLLQEICLNESGACQKYCPRLPKEWRCEISPQEMVEKLWKHQRKRQDK